MDPQTTKRCAEKLQELAALFPQPEDKDNIGLLSGLAGEALFLFYFSRKFSSEDAYSRAMDMLTLIFNKVEKQHHHYTHCSGIAGIGWLVNHLIEYDFIDADSNDIFEDIDSYIYTVALAELNRGNIDFLHGALGLTLYLIKRKKTAYVSDIVDKLYDLAIIDGDTTKWETLLDMETGRRGYNIAISHGMSATVIILSKAYMLMPENEKLKSLIESTVRYIVKQELPIEKYGSYFPYYSLESDVTSEKSRLAWCYGDLGVAMALWQTGRAMGNKDWEKKGLDVLLHSTTRREPLENKVIDSCTCHGSSGVAQIFYRMYFDTKREEFKDAADYWAVKTLDMAVHPDGFGGYKSWHTEAYGGWKADADILEGVSGVGLCLLSAISEENPAWDECLLLS